MSLLSLRGLCVLCGESCARCVRSPRMLSCRKASAPRRSHIRDGVIERILAFATQTIRPAPKSSTPADLVVSPGLVDTHVHVNEPGRTEWEGFDTATRAAAAGGVTTIVDMPLNSIPATTTVAALHAKREAARAQCHVDVGFWGGVVPGNAGELEALIDAGVRGFKCFLVPSGVDEFPAVTKTICGRRCRSSRAATCRCWSTRNRPSCFGTAADPAARVGRVTQPYLATAPAEAEVDAIRLIDAPGRRVRRARAHRARVVGRGGRGDRARPRPRGADHRRNLPALSDVRRRGDSRRRDGVQVCAADPRGRRIARRCGTAWTAARSTLIVTDHSPAPPALKPAAAISCTAWGGIASLELSLAATWTVSALTAASASSSVRVRGSARAPVPLAAG